MGPLAPRKETLRATAKRKAPRPRKAWCPAPGATPRDRCCWVRPRPAARRGTAQWGTARWGTVPRPARRRHPRAQERSTPSQDAANLSCCLSPHLGRDDPQDRCRRRQNPPAARPAVSGADRNRGSSGKSRANRGQWAARKAPKARRLRRRVRGELAVGAPRGIRRAGAMPASRQQPGHAHATGSKCSP
jgi:hypothetical protein